MRLAERFAPAPARRFARRGGRALEGVYWALALAVYFIAPTYLNFAASVAVMALFALSLDLVMGFAGIVTLGHAAFFGVGAYAAGLLAVHGWGEPISGALFGGAVSAIVAVVVGPPLLRLKSLPLVMATLAVGVIFLEAANKATWLTGGDDGLSGVEISPLFGAFDWPLDGSTQYLYALGWLALSFYALRRVIGSPFGLTLEGIRENELRMRVIGAPVLRRLVVVYAISAFVAGVAGALSAQTTNFVGLIVFSLETSVDALLIVVLGGLGTPFGALIGAPLYMAVKEASKQWDPHLWMLFVGGLLILVTLYGRGGVVGVATRAFARWRAPA